MFTFFKWLCVFIGALFLAFVGASMLVFLANDYRDQIVTQTVRQAQHSAQQ